MVECHNCGQRWPRDPALEVPCPRCQAPIGSWCKRPSEHKAMDLHAERDIEAMRLGLLATCPAVPQPSLFNQPVGSASNG